MDSDRDETSADGCLSYFTLVIESPSDQKNIFLFF